MKKEDLLLYLTHDVAESETIYINDEEQAILEEAVHAYAEQIKDHQEDVTKLFSALAKAGILNERQKKEGGLDHDV